MRVPYGKTVMSCQSSKRRTAEIKTVESEGKTGTHGILEYMKTKNNILYVGEGIR